MRPVQNAPLNEQMLHLANVVQDVLTALDTQNQQLQQALGFAVATATQQGVDLTKGHIFRPDQVRSEEKVEIKYFDKPEKEQIDIVKKLRACPNFSEQVLTEKFFKRLYKEVFVEIFGKAHIGKYTVAKNPQDSKGYTPIPTSLRASIASKYDAIISLLSNGHYDLPTANKLIAELSLGNEVQQHQECDPDMDFEMENEEDDNTEGVEIEDDLEESEDSTDENEHLEDFVPGEQKMIFLHDICTSYASESSVKQRIKSDNARFGSSNLVQFKDVEQFKNNVRAKYQSGQILLCHVCEEVIPHDTSICANCNTKNRATKEYRPTGIATSSIIPQLRDILKRTAHLLVQPHEFERGELGQFPKSQIKHVDEKTVILKLLCNTDGVSPKQNFRGSFWPLYFQIGQLPAHVRGLFVNTAIGGILTCSSKPPTKAWDLMFEHVLKLLHELKSVVKPNRVGYKSLWPITGPVVLRESHNIREDMINRKNGFDGLVPVMKIANPLSIRIDALHVLDEGLLPRILDKYLKKSKEQMRELSRVYLSSKCPAFYDPKPRSLLEYGSFNGGDKRLLFFIFLPILLIDEIEANSSKSAIFLVFWYCIRIIASKKLNTALIAHLKRFIPKIADMFKSSFPEEFEQLKSHIFFIHILLEIEHFGSPYDFTASTFESNNRKLKVYIDVNDTRSLPQTILEKFLFRREIELQIRAKLNDENCTAQFKSVFQKKYSSRRYSVKPSPADSRHMSDNSILLVQFANEMSFCRVQRVTPQSTYIVKKFVGQNIMDSAFEKINDPVLKIMLDENEKIATFWIYCISSWW
uniref:Uncharacterized protein n=1 Tax=Panagrolaimus superbus TaxID=310955 RepID=A0A914Z9T6_9BILA